MAGLSTLSRTVGGYGARVFRPGEFNEFRRRCDEIAGSSDSITAEFEEGDSLAAAVPRTTVRHEYDLRVGSREDRNRGVFVAC